MLIKPKKKFWLTGPAPYYKAAGAAFTGPGDSQTFLIWGSAAYGYSAAKAALGTTKAFRVVDGSNANGQDVLVLPTGLTDAASLNTWITAHGTAHVTTLYDQVGTNNWTQATVANMPTITVSGIHGLPSLTFVSANSQILVSGSSINIAPSVTFEAVAERTANFSSGQEIIATTTHEADIAFNNTPNQITGFNGTSIQATAADSAPHVLQIAYDPTDLTANVDGASQVLVSNGNGNAQGTISLGGFVTSVFLDGMISEAGIYAATYNAAVQSNASSRYGL